MQAKSISRVVIYGGSFDPITKGHMKIITILLKMPNVDKLIITPCGDRPDKTNLLKGELRLRMLSLACETKLMVSPTLINSQHKNCLENSNKLLIDTFEIFEYQKMLPVAFLLKKYHENYPLKHFWYVIGSDLLSSLQNWVLFNEYLRSQHFIIFKRTKNVSLENLNLENFEIQNEIICPTESTFVRKAFQEFWQNESEENSTEKRKKIMELMSECIEPEIADFILENKIYKF